MMFTNTGNLAFPLVLLAFGQQAMPAIVVVFIVSQFLHFSLGFLYLRTERPKSLTQSQPQPFLQPWPE